MIRTVAVGVVVVAGCVALMLVGAPDAAAAGLAVSATLGAPVLRRHAFRLPWTALTLLTVAALGVAVVRGTAPAEALGVLLAYLQIHGRITRTGDADDRKAIVLAALMLVISAGVSRDPLFAVAVVAYAAAFPVALLATDVSARVAGGVSAAGSILAALLFVAAPRGAPAGSDDTIELTGFASRVELGALDVLLDDPTVVFRAVVTPPPTGPIYWRGVALDRFDGSTWESGSPAVPTTIQPPARFPYDAVILEVAPVEPGVLFTAGWPLDLDVAGTLLADGQGGFSVRSPIDRYRVVAQAPLGLGDRPFSPPESDPAALARALVLPADLDPRIAALAARIAGEGPARQQVARLADHLRATYGYTRRPRDAGSEAPLPEFLFDRRAGHCEYFAAALAVLARTRGIPARVVNGFVGGERDPETGGWTVRRYDAHAWVEFHDGGWMSADATPGPSATELGTPARRNPSLRDRWQALWDDAILGYDRSDQVDAVLGAGRVAEGWLPGIAPGRLPWRGLALLGGSAWVVAWLGHRVGSRLARRLLDPPSSEPVGPVARAHHRARKVVTDRGWRIPPGLPPVDAARWLAARAPGDPADALLELAWLYYAVHLGGREASAEAGAARALLERVQRLASVDGRDIRAAG